jgi:hypothetical protein
MHEPDVADESPETVVAPTVTQVVLDPSEYWARLSLIALTCLVAGFVTGMSCR